MIAPPFVAVPPARYGGTELVLAVLVEGLVARGHAVTLYASGDSAVSGATLRAHFPSAVWPVDPQFELVQAATAVWDLVARDDADIVHAHAAAAIAFAPLLRRPMVYTVHHDRHEATCELLRGVGDAPLTTIAISHRQRMRLEGIPAEVIHHGLPPDRYPPGRSKGRYAAFLGRFAREKGVAEALDAAREAGLPLHLAGRPHPPDADYYRDEVVPRLQGPGIRWLGEVGHEAKVRLLREALVTLFPIDWEEPFGLVMIESMLCGTPVVAYDRGSVPELVEDGVTGFVVGDRAEMVTRIRQLAERPFDRARCRATAIARFGVERMVSAYLGVYGAALARRRAHVEAG